MQKKVKKLKKRDISLFFTTTFTLFLIGAFVYISSLLPVYAKDNHMFAILIAKYFFFGFIGGSISFILASKIPPAFLKKISPYLYGIAIILLILVFIPGIGVSYGGAHRWISLFFFSFQPVEFFKISFILFFSFLLSKYEKYISSFPYLLLFFLALLPVILLLKQPDTSSSVFIVGLTLLLLYVRGAKIKHLLLIVFIFILFFSFHVKKNPYILRRFEAYLHPQEHIFDDSWQITNAKISIGSGKLLGRGLFRGRKKFGPFLPESSSDTIFAVYAEELGFFGSFVLIFLYVLLAFFGIRIAKRSENTFDQSVSFGIIFIIVGQSLMNIATISGMIPLSGFPLIFLSGGISALLMSLIGLGIVYGIGKRNIYRYKKKK